MTSYLAGVLSSGLSFVFIIFAIGALGYLVGGIKIKGIELGTAGVLLIALLYGVLVSYVPSFDVHGTTITLWNSVAKGNFSTVSNIGTALFVTAVGLIAGPKFFRSFNRSTFSYIILGVIVIAIGTITAVIFVKCDKNLSPEMAVGLLTGALTSTPGLSAAKEVAENADQTVAGYGIAYLFGVMGVVLFVQIVPKILKVDMQKEVENFKAANAVQVPEPKGKLLKLDPFDFFPFVLAVAFGCLIGAIKIPVGTTEIIVDGETIKNISYFNLGNSGGCLVGGLIVAHFAHLGFIDLRIKKETLNFMRELGLVLFLIGAGVPGGVNFVANFRVSYFLYGVALTLMPMIIGYIIARYVFKLSILNNLGSITGGMTSTPALGTLIATAGTDEVSSAYAATYPFALVSIVLAAKIIVIAL